MFRSLLLAAELLAASPARTFAQASTCDPIDLVFATTPAPPMSSANYREFERQKAAMSSPVDLVLLGDSITHRWPAAATVPGARVLNLGVEGDRTQNLLWRIQKYPLGQISPRFVTLFIGTNNLGNKESACQTEAGTNEIVGLLRKAWPSATLVLLGVARRGETLAFREADREAINAGYARIARAQGATYLDLDALLDCPRASGCAYYLPDMLHFQRAAYDVIAEALSKILR